MNTTDCALTVAVAALTFVCLRLRMDLHELRSVHIAAMKILGRRLDACELEASKKEFEI